MSHISGRMRDSLTYDMLFSLVSLCNSTVCTQILFRNCLLIQNLIFWGVLQFPDLNTSPSGLSDLVFYLFYLSFHNAWFCQFCAGFIQWLFLWVILLGNLLMHILKLLINILNVISYLQTLLVNPVLQHCPLEGQRRPLLHHQVKSLQEVRGIQLQMENFLKR